MQSYFDRYFSRFPVHTYKKRWSIVNPGDNLRTIYYLKKGYVRLYSISQEGQELTLIVYKPGEFFPLFAALLPPAPYRYWVETMTPAEIVSVPIESFKTFYTKTPDFTVFLATELISRLDRVLRRMENLAFGSVTQRLITTLLILSERFGEKHAEGLYIQPPFTHKELANMVGITRETASSIMSDLKKRGLIDYKNHHIIIKQPQKLLKESLP